MSSRGEATRVRILDTTSELLARRGTTGTGFNQIVEESGVAYGSIYHQFKGGKSALIAAAVRHGGGLIGEAMQIVLASTDSLADAVGLLFDVGLASLEESGFERGCPVGTAVSDGHTNADVRTASSEVFAAWTDAIASAAVGHGAEATAASTFAILAVTIYEGALLVSRAHHAASPLQAAKALAMQLAEEVVA